MIDQQEVREAIAAADDALEKLNAAQSSLKSAGNWGILDMLGGGFLSTLMKHGKMDRAQEQMESARSSLRRFARELGDVSSEVSIQIDTGDFLRFADYFFDGIIADWMVQSKIEKAEQQVSDAIQKVWSIRSRLEQML